MKLSLQQVSIIALIIIGNHGQTPSGGLSCIQCDPSIISEDNTSCLQGGLDPTQCPLPTPPGNWRACNTVLTLNNGAFARISRRCTTENQNNSWVHNPGPSWLSWLNVTHRIYACGTPGCNNIDLTANVSVPVTDITYKCLSCYGVESEDPKKENTCNQKLGYNSVGPVTTLCKIYPCLYEETRDKVTGRLLSVKRGCSRAFPEKAFQTYDVCDQDQERDNTKIKRCYCYDTECNRNIPEIKCQTCRYNYPGCSEGTAKGKVCEPTFLYNYLGATGISCKETKVTDKVTRKLLGYDRGCSSYRETGCDANRTVCYCNSSGCVNNRHTNTSRRHNENLPFIVIVTIILLRRSLSYSRNI